MTTTAPTNNPAGVATERSSRRRRGLYRTPGLPWILPALVVSVGVLYYCIGYTGYLSTLDWDGASPLQRQIGLANYVQMFQDPIFWRALGNTAAFYVVTFTVQVALGIVLACLLHSRLYAKTLYKVLIFIPVVLAPATTAPVFRQIYAPGGTLNQLLDGVGLGAFTQPWFANGTIALIIIMSVQIWQSTGIVFILYFAAIGQISPEMVEAARIDGAGDLRVVTSIVWPSVRGTTVAIAILSAIGSLKTFDIPFLITGGGPTYATEFLGTRIYRISVGFSDVGLGAAFSIVLLVLAVGTAVLIQVGSRRKEGSA
ncbi:carbohydrate ABC transporter permease [Amnibacterium endophyticum]|uniref:Carbohydrate ABC transporter permease n=1 Tax=Amnibacterium endophyticum TaxID=2109337 RepID=A0ABW4LDN7_9MICO